MANKLTDVGFVFFFDWADILSSLSGDDFKALMLATAAYAQGGDPPDDLPAAAQMAFRFIASSIERWHEKSDARAESGRRGGLARANKAEAGKVKQTEANDSADRQSEANASYYPNPNPDPDFHPDLYFHPHPHPHPSCARADAQEEAAEPRVREEAAEPQVRRDESPKSEGFDLFWDAYPRKLKKSDARLAWSLLAPDEALTDRIVRTVLHLADSPDWQRESGRFVPLPAKWLTERRFEDVSAHELDPWGEITELDDYTARQTATLASG